MIISVSDRRFELLNSDTQGLTKSQQETLDLLWSLEHPKTTAYEVCNQLGIKLLASFNSRVEHLEDRGKIREVKTVG